MNSANFLNYKNLYIIPTFHSRVEFAKLTRIAFFQVFPDLIAVELPSNTRKEVLEAVQRLPYLSLIGYADSLRPDRLNFIPIDPGDSIIEGIRLGLEFNTPIEFIDLSVKNYDPPPTHLPDDHSITSIGLNHFYKKVSEYFQEDYFKKKETIRSKVNLKYYLEHLEKDEEKSDTIEVDILREKYMATHLLKLMNLHHRILFIVGMAHWENIRYFLDHPEELEDINSELEPHKLIKIYNIRGKDARFLLRELPYHVVKWMKFRDSHAKEDIERMESIEDLLQTFNLYDKKKHVHEILLKAKSEYEEEFKEFINLHQLKSLFQYIRNISLTDKRLLPNLFHFLISAKSIIDDDYAWKVLKIATRYPHDDQEDHYETLELSQEGARDSTGRYIRLRRHHPFSDQDSRDIPLKKRPKENHEGEWRNEWEKNKWRTVSYPPEDVIEEDYFAYIRNKTIKNLKNKKIKIEQFKTSMMDGIAIRETLRNWAIKKQIYVRNEHRIQGKIDTIIVIFDVDDKGEEKYPYRLTWWAEHEKESDLAFYATNPGDYLIGPGISHVEIGGLLSFFPAIKIREIFSPFEDEIYSDTLNKAERLLKAGILFSKQKYIAYVAEMPPRKYFHDMAGKKNRTLIYIPMADFNKESLKRIKHLHILAGKDKRKIAHEYIFL